MTKKKISKGLKFEFRPYGKTSPKKGLFRKLFYDDMEENLATVFIEKDGNKDNYDVDYKPFSNQIFESLTKQISLAQKMGEHYLKNPSYVGGDSTMNKIEVDIRYFQRSFDPFAIKRLKKYFT